MLTAHDPAVLRARTWDHGARPMSSAGLAPAALAGVTGIAANGLVFVAEQDAERAAPAAREAGMTPLGPASLMTLELDLALAEAPCRGVERAVDRTTIGELD